ncbi:hypothetical protein JXB28_00925 [Candidatus Woesearchaeota archaeon]|nr:hypothetical protein [Candidatus Woesearchaeota archaeon]
MKKPTKRDKHYVDPESKGRNLNRDWNRKTGLLFIALTTICIFLSLAMILRAYHDKPVFPLGESYYSMRMANTILDEGFISKDPLQGTDYAPNPYHYLLSLLLLIFGSYFVLWFVPILLGVASAWLFFKLLSGLGMGWEKAFYALLVLSVSPIFLVAFTGLYLIGWVLFISLLSLVLLLPKNKLAKCLGISCLIILVLSSLMGFIITFLGLLAIHVMLKKNPKALALHAIIPLAALILAHILLRQFPLIVGFGAFDFKDTLSLLGARFGFDLFLLLIFTIGFIVAWSSSKATRLIHLAILFFIIFSFFNYVARAFASLIVAYYCVIAITFLYRRNWSLEIIKTGTMLLVLCSLVFSLANQLNLLVTSQPDESLVKSIIFLEGLEDGIVLSDESYGFLIEFYSGKQAFIDENSFVLGDSYNDKVTDFYALFNSVRITEAKPLLDKHSIRYVLITPSMKEQLWENNERGLWRLMKNSESFSKRYLEDDIEIREYTPPIPEMPPV